jgi:PKD repeat protein
MQNKRSKWLVGLSLAAALVLGLTPLATAAATNTWTPVNLKPNHNSESPLATATTGKRSPGQAPAFQVKLSPAMKQLQAEMKAAGVKPWQLPKQRFQYPAYRMLVNAAKKAGVPVSQAIQKNPESLCETQAGWFNGPAMASNTNGTAIVYGGGMNFYFASASDPTHPTVIPAGDIMMRVYFQGNTAIVLGYVMAYAFDVSNPTQPALLGYDYAGYAFSFTGFGMTSDGQWIVGINFNDDLVVWDNTFTYVTDTDLETINPSHTWSYTPELTDMTVVGSTVLITDWDNYYIHFVDLSDVACSGPMYLGYIDDFTYGNRDCAQILYQAPYLYTVNEPWFYYSPLGYARWPNNYYYVDIFNVPDVTKPAHFISVKFTYQNNYGNDIVAIRPAGNGNVALGLYDGQVAIWDAQFNTLLSFGTMGKFGPATQGYGWWGTEPNWEYFTLDMGYDPAAGGVTANWGGGAYFFNGGLSQTGSYTTGDWAYNPVAVGNTIYTPSYVAGLAIVDNTNPTDPTTLGWLPTNAALPFIGQVAVDGTTAYVAADYNTSYTKVFAADVTNPAAPGYISTASTAFDITAHPGYGTEIESLAANGGICWIGTDTSLVGVDFLTNPAAPTVVASFTITGSGTYGMTTFTLPAFPVSHFLAVAEGNEIEVYDITSPTQYAGCPKPYFFVNRLAPTGWATDLFAYNSYLIYNDITNNAVSSMSLTATVSSACDPGEVTLAASDSLTLGVIGGPYLVAYAGTVGGHVVMAAADQWDMTTIDITNPTALAFLNSPPQEVSGPSLGGITGLLFSNGALYNAGGYVGLFNYLLEPGFTPPTVNTVTVTPAIGGYLTGPVTLSANVTAADSAVTSVVFTFSGFTIATVPTNIAPGATQTVTYTWNTSAWTHGCGATDVFATAYDSGCNESVAVGSGSNYNINLAPNVTLSNWNPPIPSGGTCAAPGSWVVCGNLTLTATATDGTCNQVTGISQMSLYVDGVFVTYINNPTGNTWDIILDTTTLSDGLHTLKVTATDAMGLTGSKSSATFLVHNVGPKVVVTAPVSGNVVSGTAIRVAATAVPSTSDFSIAKVVFYLDKNSSNPVLLGTATTPDSNGEYSITWDSTATGTDTGYGNHDIIAMALDNAGSCASWGLSDLVSFNLIQYTPPTLTATATPTSGNIPLAVAFAANVTNGQAPFTYAWDFGDGNTGSGQATTHTYATAGTFNWTVTVTDGQNNTATASGSVTAINPIIPPIISSVVKVNDASGFRLKIYGNNFHQNCTIKINGAMVPTTKWKSNTQVNAKGSGLKSMVPKGVTVQITVTNNDDGGVSAAYAYTR